MKVGSEIRQVKCVFFNQGTEAQLKNYIMFTLSYNLSLTE